MPSSFAHGLVAIAAGGLCYPAARGRFYAVAAVSAGVPDLDALGRPVGLGDLALLDGHRALTHSLAFSVAFAVVAVAAACRGREWDGRRLAAWGFFAGVIALHGALDALTTYGDGVMFFAPFSTLRFKAPWQPLDGLPSEILGIWLPAAMLFMYGRRRGRASLEVPMP